MSYLFQEVLQKYVGDDYMQFLSTLMYFIYSVVKFSTVKDPYQRAIWQLWKDKCIHNAGRVLNILGFQIYQVSTCASVAKGSAYGWIWLNNAWINRSDYSRVLNMRGQSFTELWVCLWFSICRGLEYRKVVNMRELRKVLPEYVWIILNMP